MEQKVITTQIAEVRPLRMRDLEGAVCLHQKQLTSEFIVQFGDRFLRKYYQAFVESPYAAALVALDVETEHIMGILLGSLDAHAHYRFVTRHFGWQLAVLALFQSLFRPKLALELVRTRAKRYVRGIIRNCLSIKRLHNNKPSALEQVEKVGDLTHLCVDTAVRSKGVGTELVQAYERLAWQFNLARIDLVTLPRQLGGAGEFYERVGFTCVGTQVSSSGEVFLLYRKHLLKPSLPGGVELLP